MDIYIYIYIHYGTVKDGFVIYGRDLSHMGSEKIHLGFVKYGLGFVTYGEYPHM